MGGLLHYREKGSGRVAAHHRPLLAVPNVTRHCKYLCPSKGKLEFISRHDVFSTVSFFGRQKNKRLTKLTNGSAETTYRGL